MSKPIDIQKLTQRKVTVPLILIAAVAVFAWRLDSFTVDYLDDFFITRVEATEQYEIVTAQVSENADLIKGHISEYKLNENAREIRAAEDALYNLELYVAANTESKLTRDRKRSLDSTLSRLGRVRACIVRANKLENCSAIL